MVESGIRFDFQAISSFEDYLVNIGCFAAAKRVALIQEVSYFYRTRSGSASQSDAPGAGFVRLLRGFAGCLAAYPAAEPEFVASVSYLFGQQLGFDCYQVRNLGELEGQRDEIAAVLKQLAATRPEAIYSLLHSRPRRVLGGSVLRRTLRKLFAVQ